MASALLTAPVDSSTDLPLWADGAVTDRGLEIYTEGDCWALAYALSTLMEERPSHLARLYTLGRCDSWWHVAVEVEAGLFLDAEGLHSRQALEEKWGRLAHSVLACNADSWATFMDYLGADWSFAPREAEALAVARLLLETHAPSALKAV